MRALELIRYESGGVTLLGDSHRPGGVTFAFTERTGGVSEAPYASLNLGSQVGDDPACVAENRRRVMAALGAAELAERIVCPKQVHGDRVLRLRAADDPSLVRVRQEAQEGADAIVCVARDVPVLLCAADCVLVVLACAGGFAVVHSGWRGSMARIAGKAALALCEEAQVGADQLVAYVGPHIGRADYEVSPELAERFREEFGREAADDEHHVDLTFCVRSALEDVGVRAEAIAASEDSTAAQTQRYYSYRAEGGSCGRHGALAFMRSAG